MASGRRWRLLVALDPPLLAELAVRALRRSDLEVVADPAGASTPGTYDGAVRNVAIHPETRLDLIVELPPADTPVAPAPVAAGEVFVLDRLGQVAELLGERWPPASDALLH